MIHLIISLFLSLPLNNLTAQQKDSILSYDVEQCMLKWQNVEQWTNNLATLDQAQITFNLTKNKVLYIVGLDNPELNISFKILETTVDSSYAVFGFRKLTFKCSISDNKSLFVFELLDSNFSDCAEFNLFQKIEDKLNVRYRLKRK